MESVAVSKKKTAPATNKTVGVSKKKTAPATNKTGSTLSGCPVSKTAQAASDDDASTPTPTTTSHLNPPPQLNADPTEPHSRMMEYVPFNKGRDYDSQTLVFLKAGNVHDTRRLAFYERVKKWLLNEIKDPVVFAIAPGSAANPDPGGFLYEIMGILKKETVKKAPLITDTITLIRTTKVDKSATTPGPRSKTRHSGTISVKALDAASSTPSHSGMVVVILDDVWTSGSTLCFCKDVVKDKYPLVKDIKLFAIARTV